MMQLSGTEGYADEADDLMTRYESRSFTDTHRFVMHLVPTEPCRVLDIGAGTGRDAAGFAALGHSVLAVEPTDALRERAMALHREPNIEWLDDGLPDLARLRARKTAFDVVMLTAVWMHLDEDQRRRAFPNVAAMVAEAGVLLMSLRHGPVPEGRRMFEVTADETIRLAEALGLSIALTPSTLPDGQKRDGVSWTRLGFRRGSKPG